MIFIKEKPGTYEYDQLIQIFLLTVKSPIRPVSTQRLSKWVKLTLKESSIKIDTFSSYSIRHAGTSAAYRAAVSVKMIRERVGWTHKSEMFARFYNRPLCKDSTAFASDILDLS